jgi:hypothetical protein
MLFHTLGNFVSSRNRLVIRFALLQTRQENFFRRGVKRAFLMASANRTLFTRFFAKILGSWSSGYDIAFTRRRSPVRIRPGPSHFLDVQAELALYHIHTNFRMKFAQKTKGFLFAAEIAGSGRGKASNIPKAAGF